MRRTREQYEQPRRPQFQQPTDPRKQINEEIIDKFYVELNSGDIQKIKAFVLQNNNLVYSKNFTGKLLKTKDSPVHIVLTNSDIGPRKKLDIIKYLVSLGLPLDVPNKNNEWPINIAIKLQDEDLIEYFISQNVRLNVKDGYDNTPLHSAIFGNEIDCPKETKIKSLIPSQPKKKTNEAYAKSNAIIMNLLNTDNDLNQKVIKIINSIYNIPSHLKGTEYDDELDKDIKNVFIKAANNPSYDTADVQSQENELMTLVKKAEQTIDDNILGKITSTTTIELLKEGWRPQLTYKGVGVFGDPMMKTVEEKNIEEIEKSYKELYDGITDSKKNPINEIDKVSTETEKLMLNAILKHMFGFDNDKPTQPIDYDGIGINTTFSKLLYLTMINDTIINFNELVADFIIHGHNTNLFSPSVNWGLLMAGFVNKLPMNYFRWKGDVVINGVIEGQDVGTVVPIPLGNHYILPFCDIALPGYISIKTIQVTEPRNETVIKGVINYYPISCAEYGTSGVTNILDRLFNTDTNYPNYNEYRASTLNIINDAWTSQFGAGQLPDRNSFRQTIKDLFYMYTNNDFVFFSDYPEYTKKIGDLFDDEEYKNFIRNEPSSIKGISFERLFQKVIEDLKPRVIPPSVIEPLTFVGVRRHQMYYIDKMILGRAYDYDDIFLPDTNGKLNYDTYMNIFVTVSETKEVGSGSKGNETVIRPILSDAFLNTNLNNDASIFNNDYISNYAGGLAFFYHPTEIHDFCVIERGKPFQFAPYYHYVSNAYVPGIIDEYTIASPHDAKVNLFYSYSYTHTHLTNDYAPKPQYIEYKTQKRYGIPRPGIFKPDYYYREFISNDERLPNGMIERDNIVDGNGLQISYGRLLREPYGNPLLGTFNALDGTYSPTTSNDGFPDKNRGIPVGLYPHFVRNGRMYEYGLGTYSTFVNNQIATFNGLSETGNFNTTKGNVNTSLTNFNTVKNVLFNDIDKVIDGTNQIQLEKDGQAGMVGFENNIYKMSKGFGDSIISDRTIYAEFKNDITNLRNISERLTEINPLKDFYSPEFYDTIHDTMLTNAKIILFFESHIKGENNERGGRTILKKYAMERIPGRTETYAEAATRVIGDINVQETVNNMLAPQFRRTDATELHVATIMMNSAALFVLESALSEVYNGANSGTNIGVITDMNANGGNWDPSSAFNDHAIITDAEVFMGGDGMGNFTNGGGQVWFNTPEDEQIIISYIATTLLFQDTVSNYFGQLAVADVNNTAAIQAAQGNFTAHRNNAVNNLFGSAANIGFLINGLIHADILNFIYNNVVNGNVRLTPEHILTMIQPQQIMLDIDTKIVASTRTPQPGGGNGPFRVFPRNENGTPVLAQGRSIFIAPQTVESLVHCDHPSIMILKINDETVFVGYDNSRINVGYSLVDIFIHTIIRSLNANGNPANPLNIRRFIAAMTVVAANYDTEIINAVGYNNIGILYQNPATGNPYSISSMELINVIITAERDRGFFKAPLIDITSFLLVRCMEMMNAFTFIEAFFDDSQEAGGGFGGELYGFDAPKMNNVKELTKLAKETLRLIRQCIVLAPYIEQYQIATGTAGHATLDPGTFRELKAIKNGTLLRRPVVPNQLPGERHANVGTEKFHEMNDPKNEGKITLMEMCIYFDFLNQHVTKGYYNIVFQNTYIPPLFEYPLDKLDTFVDDVIATQKVFGETATVGVKYPEFVLSYKLLVRILIKKLRDAFANWCSGVINKIENRWLINGNIGKDIRKQVASLGNDSMNRIFATVPMNDAIMTAFLLNVSDFFYSNDQASMFQKLSKLKWNNDHPLMKAMKKIKPLISFKEKMDLVAFDNTEPVVNPVNPIPNFWDSLHNYNIENNAQIVRSAWPNPYEPQFRFYYAISHLLRKFKIIVNKPINKKVLKFFDIDSDNSISFKNEIKSYFELNKIITTNNSTDNTALAGIIYLVTQTLQITDGDLLNVFNSYSHVFPEKFLNTNHNHELYFSEGCLYILIRLFKMYKRSNIEDDVAYLKRTMDLITSTIRVFPYFAANYLLPLIFVVALKILYDDCNNIIEIVDLVKKKQSMYITKVDRNPKIDESNNNISRAIATQDNVLKTVLNFINSLTKYHNQVTDFLNFQNTYKLLREKDPRNLNKPNRINVFTKKLPMVKEIKITSFNKDVLDNQTKEIFKDYVFDNINYHYEAGPNSAMRGRELYTINFLNIRTHVGNKLLAINKSDIKRDNSGDLTQNLVMTNRATNVFVPFFAVSPSANGSVIIKCVQQFDGGNIIPCDFPWVFGPAFIGLVNDSIDIDIAKKTTSGINALITNTDLAKTHLNTLKMEAIQRIIKFVIEEKNKRGPPIDANAIELFNLISTMGNDNNTFKEIDDSKTFIIMGKMTDDIINKLLKYAISQASYDWVMDKVKSNIHYNKITGSKLQMLIPETPSEIKLTESNYSDLKNIFGANQVPQSYQVPQIESKIDDVNLKKFVHYIYDINYFSQSIESMQKCYKVNINIIDKIITPENINAKNSNGMTPMHIAVDMCNPVALDMLLDRGSKSHTFKDVFMRTPFDILKQKIDTHTQYIKINKTIKESLAYFIEPYKEIIIKKLKDPKFNGNIIKFTDKCVSIMTVMINHTYHLMLHNYRYNFSRELKDKIVNHCTSLLSQINPSTYPIDLFRIESIQELKNVSKLDQEEIIVNDRINNDSKRNNLLKQITELNTTINGLERDKELVLGNELLEIETMIADNKRKKKDLEDQLTDIDPIAEPNPEYLVLYDASFRSITNKTISRTSSLIDFYLSSFRLIGNSNDFFIGIWDNYLQKHPSKTSSMVLNNMHLLMRTLIEDQNNDLAKDLNEYFTLVKDYIETKASSPKELLKNPILTSEFEMIKYIINLIVTPAVQNIILSEIHSYLEDMDATKRMTKYNVTAGQSLNVPHEITKIQKISFGGQTIESYLFNVLPRRAFKHFSQIYDGPEDSDMNIVETDLFEPIITILKQHHGFFDDDSVFITNYRTYLIPFFMNTYSAVITTLNLVIYGHEKYLLQSYQLMKMFSSLI